MEELKNSFNNGIAHNCYIIVGNSEKAKNFIKNEISFSEIVFFEYDIFGIDESRKISSLAKSFPDGNKRAFFISFGKISEEAQNALLKTLEDSSSSNYFFICVLSAGALLPTIISRAEIVKCGGIENSDALNFLEKSAPERMKYIEKLSKKNVSEVMQFLIDLEKELFGKVKNNTKSCQILIEYRKKLEGNSIGMKSMLETLALTLPKL